jgi:hypothetical protein
VKPATYQVFAVISMVLMLLAGCSQPATSPEGSGARQAAATDTQAMTKRPGGPLWNVEYVGAVLEAYKHTSFEAPAHGELDIGGWAVDQDAKASAGGVEIRIDGSTFAGEYGKPRPDVASLFSQPAYANVGYMIRIKADQFASGTHTAYFRVLSNDRKSFWEAGPYTISFK